MLKKVLLFAGILFISAQCGPGTPEQQAQSMYEYEKRYDAEMQRLEEQEAIEEEAEWPLAECNTKEGSLKVLIIFLLLVSLVIAWGPKWYPPMKKYWDEIEVD